MGGGVEAAPGLRSRAAAAPLPPTPSRKGRGSLVVARARQSPYPERHTRPPGLVEEYLRATAALLPRPPQALLPPGRGARGKARRDTHARKQQRWAEAPEAAAAALRARLRSGITPTLAARAFALIRAVATRQLGLTPYEVQLMAAWSMLRGRMAELATGEGKTLAASLTAATAALAGRMVHVVTVNDYLAERDHALLVAAVSGAGTDRGPGRARADARRSGAPPMPAISSMPATRNWCSTTCATRCAGAPRRPRCMAASPGWTGAGRMKTRWCCAAWISRSSTRPTAC